MWPLIQICLYSALLQALFDLARVFQVIGLVVCLFFWFFFFFFENFLFG
jgi:hypothetical protein